MNINFIIDLLISTKYNIIIIIINIYTKITYFKLITLKDPIKKKWVNTINIIKIIYYYIFY